ncbi:CDP-alcohol phosphatidyltransferase family protein [Pokkaliibacter sp. MBI-7]|uniref:CDP-alcohol phosphatidyltransferase family protein n=1 Tax=Pokkaliibacter sp. MBI-7 TaxID=3040600 RepID=UPI0024489CE3|nr:CDP-alcohol phosphatidyltransferase family protein [Pokkaliibacter sp. MBI-7]MDH2434341.1 CDP-alcohol phosphatidyltransferase family protein [Pokkaliibacter sp. MBI-7]
MLDRYTSRWVQPSLKVLAYHARREEISADQLTVLGFVFGLMAMAAITLGHFELALVLLLINRFLDGLDGAVARQTQPSDAGGYLDICLDFLIYSGVIWAFALAEPANATAAATLIFAFVGTGSSFLAFAAVAARRSLVQPQAVHKSLYYLGGLTEGTETILFFVLLCLFPGAFVPLAYGFAGLCAITTATRIVGGYRTLRQP